MRGLNSTPSASMGEGSGGSERIALSPHPILPPPGGKGLYLPMAARGGEEIWMERVGSRASAAARQGVADLLFRLPWHPGGEGGGWGQLHPGGRGNVWPGGGVRLRQDYYVPFPRALVTPRRPHCGRTC